MIDDMSRVVTLYRLCCENDDRKLMRRRDWDTLGIYIQEKTTQRTRAHFGTAKYLPRICEAINNLPLIYLELLRQPKCVYYNGVRMRPSRPQDINVLPSPTSLRLTYPLPSNVEATFNIKYPMILNYLLLKEFNLLTAEEETSSLYDRVMSKKALLRMKCFATWQRTYGQAVHGRGHHIYGKVDDADKVTFCAYYPQYAHEIERIVYLWENIHNVKGYMDDDKRAFLRERR